MSRYRILSFVPAIALLCLIFSFSAQTGKESGSLSYKMMEIKNQVFQENKNEIQITRAAEKIHYYVRKAAHMTEYFLLALSFAYPLYLYKVRGRKLFFIVICVCVLAAGLDEYHQTFVAGRGPSIKDVGIDSTGAFIGCCIASGIERFKINRKKKNSEK